METIIEINNRDGVDTRNKDLTVACDEKQELAYNCCDSCCEAIATVILELKDGRTVPLCDTCDIHLRETFAELEDQVYNRLENVVFWNEEDYDGCICEDCKQSPATCEFLHFDGRLFLLCAGCYGHADHDPDYLNPDPETPPNTPDAN